MTSLRHCPDCGGLLESTHPAYLATIDAAAARDPDEPAEMPALPVWRCHICGYGELDDGTPAPDAKA